MAISNFQKTISKKFPIFNFQILFGYWNLRFFWKLFFGNWKFYQTLALILIITPTTVIAKQSNTITIGSKNFTEQAILGELMAQIIEAKTDLKVERKFFLGGSQFTFEALKAGEIDLYAEYTGTGLVSILKMQPSSNPNITYQTVKKEFAKQFGLSWLKPLGFNNTYAMAFRPDDERVKNISTLSELKNISPNIIFGAPHEFLERKDGFSQLKDKYGFQFKKFVGLDPGIMYTALIQDQVDIITGFSTDGRIEKFKLKVLKDDKQFFPPYYAAPVIRDEVLKKHPELKGVLNLLAGQISDAEMTKMNYLVDLNGHSPKQVAKDFLSSKGLVSSSSAPLVTRRTSLASFFLSQKSYLARLTLQHLNMVVIALAIAMVLGIPIGIILTRMQNLSGPVFAIVNTIQTIPSLALLGFMIPLIGIGTTPAIVALFLYSLLPLIRNTYTGIQSIDPHLKEVAKGMGLTDFQILRKVEFPLASPTILAGIRISTVIMVGTATLAALIGAGGLGDPIFRGISSVNNDLIILGAVPAALLAIVLDRTLHFIETRLNKTQS